MLLVCPVFLIDFFSVYEVCVSGLGSRIASRVANGPTGQVLEAGLGWSVLVDVDD